METVIDKLKRLVKVAEMKMPKEKYLYGLVD
jgi:hypothetical protein